MSSDKIKRQQLDYYYRRRKRLKETAPEELDKLLALKSEYDKGYYIINKERVLDRVHRNKPNKEMRKRQNLERVNTYKLRGCQYCGYNKCLASLDFHHIGEKEISGRKGNISYMILNGCSWEKIFQEISQCILLCANCHRELHYNERMRVIGQKESLIKPN